MMGEQTKCDLPISADADRYYLLRNMLLPSTALRSLQRLAQGHSPLELVHTPHEFWPYRPGFTHHSSPILRISVLDSSFNPPTLAHLALVNSRPPWQDLQAETSQYDAKLLLLSVRNADKTLKPGDASYIQRLEMMYLLSRSEHGISSLTSDNNTAVAIIDEPTFVGKSTVLLNFLRTRLASLGAAGSPTIPQPKLTFLMGLDTLVRLFSVKYYTSEHELRRLLHNFLSPDAEDCRIVCARRASLSDGCMLEDDAENGIQSIVHEVIGNDRIHIIDIGKDEQAFSSSQVRTQIAAGDDDWRRLVTDLVADYLIDNRLYISDPRAASE